jgi:hypothetical protein
MEDRLALRDNRLALRDNRLALRDNRLAARLEGYPAPLGAQVVERVSLAMEQQEVLESVGLVPPETRQAAAPEEVTRVDLEYQEVLESVILDSAQTR